MERKFILVICRTQTDIQKIKHTFIETESTKFYFASVCQQIRGIRWGSMRPNVLLNLAGKMNSERERDWWNQCVLPSLSHEAYQKYKGENKQ